MYLVSRSRVSTPGTDNVVSSVTFTSVFDGEIAYIQSQDLIERGQGALYITEGGVGATNVTVWTLSGYGEDVDRTIDVFGFPA